jgi:hypothetical protein
MPLETVILCAASGERRRTQQAAAPGRSATGAARAARGSHSQRDEVLARIRDLCLDTIAPNDTPSGATVSTPPSEEMRTLHGIADELLEEFEARGHRIEGAIEKDPAFDRGYVESSLGRSLIENAVLQAAVRRGVQHPDVPGGGFELQFIEGFHDRRYRIRQAKRRGGGTLYVPTNNASGLAPADGHPDHPSLIDLDQWVFAVVRDNSGAIAEVVVSRVVGATEGLPGRLVFADEITLGSSDDRPPTGFMPSDEDLDGFDEEDDDYGEAAS